MAPFIKLRGEGGGSPTGPGPLAGTAPGGCEFVRYRALPPRPDPEVRMQALSLLTLRVSIALLVLIWGLDKIVDPAHAVRVSDAFYFGALSLPALLPVVGGLQVIVALLALVGLFRRWVDPVILLINLGSLLSVWRSILDPWGWWMEGTNALFFPSLTVAAGCLVLLALRDQEAWVLDRRRQGTAPGPA